jgi:hypothetical protein
MKLIGVGLVTAFAWLVGCGGNTAHFSNQVEQEGPGTGNDGGTGAVPAGTGSGGNAGAGPDGDGAVGSGGAAGGGPVGSGGDAGSPPVDPVVGPTEQGLDPDHVITDPALLDGKSFVLPEGLCAQNEQWDDYSRNEASLRNLHVIRQGDELELVSSTPTDTSPLIQRTTLEPASLGFRATHLVVCTATNYDFEDTYKVASYEAPLAHLAFVPGQKAGTVEVKLGVWLDVDEETVVLTGGFDQQPPGIHRLHVSGEQLTAHDGGWDPVTPGGVLPPYHFFFDEPVLDSDLSLDDGSGSAIPVTKQMSDGFLVGFSVHALVLGEPSFNHGVTDLAGNASALGTYAGITLPLVGDIESGDDYAHYVYGWGIHRTALLTSLTNEDAGIGDIAVPPLSGTRSLLLDDAAVYLRVARSPGATKLSFSVRAIQSQLTDIALSIQSIRDGAESSWTFDQDPATPGDATAWVEDPAYTSDSGFVSLPEKLSVPLPETGDDLLVRIEGGVLWLDSLVTE